MNGLSLHYYTVKGWNGSKGAATKFDNDDYYWTLGKCLEIEDVINNHDSIMDKYDPAGHVALIVDEWGTWWDEEPGTISGHLYQQNTMRDAMVAALSLNVFHRHTDRVKMANIAQIANVLQSMILTKDGDMVLTPTYYVFKMYIPHQNATVIPLDIKTSTRAVRDGRTVPTISATASKKDGEMNITLTNIDLDNPAEITIPLGNDVKASGIKGEILTAGNIDDYNDFGSAEKVTLKQFDKVKYSKGALTLTLPAKSIVSLSMKI